MEGLMNKNKIIPKRKLMQYYKRFVNGEQYIWINPVTFEIEELEKHYWWTPRNVYNIIKPMIMGKTKGLTDDEIYGRNGLVSLLEPYQNMYNHIMNSKWTCINNATHGFMLCEDGSIDTDELTEDGLCPGKILIYRQGGNSPKVVRDSLNTDSYRKDAEECIKTMSDIADAYCRRIREDLKNAHDSN